MSDALGGPSFASLPLGGEAARRAAAAPMGPGLQPGLPPRAGLPRTRQLGATYDGAGTTFNVVASDATRVTLVLCAPDGTTTAEYGLGLRHGQWGGYVPEVKPGQRYGYRADGPWRPWEGLRSDPAKLLLDPAARAVDGDVRWGPEIFDTVGPNGARSDLDSAGRVPLAVVTGDDGFDWQGAEAPVGPRAKSGLTYEAHVKGMTRRLPGVPAKLQGTYLGMAHKVTIDHLRRLKVRCVELLPVQWFTDEPHLVASGLRNYWGYSPLAFSAPASRYAVSRDPLEQLREFKTMVREMHKAGIEVILDVVFNHTAEGGADGPALSFRGLDNRGYYRLGGNGAYVDLTGCSNTVDLSNPETLRLVLDSLRWWVQEMKVDGFRFDEAPVLGRDQQMRFTQRHAFFQAVHADPVLSQVRLVAEPWDVAMDSYQQGNFPEDWAEWNGRFRDTVRDFWRGAVSGVADLATRLAGSADLFAWNRRGPDASVNGVAFHDGFTIRDLVTYEQKHNEANLESNRDGAPENRSWNCGVEGETPDPAINALRARQQRNLLATLMLAQGQPLLLHGDEMGRTQDGNNNAYNQDNEISWVDWDHADTNLLAFSERLASLRETQPVLRRMHWLRGVTGPGPRDRDCVWLSPSGQEMQIGDWQDGGRRSLGMLLPYDPRIDVDESGAPEPGDSLLLLFHSGPDDVRWTLPSGWSDRWEVVLDTASPAEAEGARSVADGGALDIRSRSVVVLRPVRPTA